MCNVLSTLQRSLVQLFSDNIRNNNMENSKHGALKQALLNGPRSELSETYKLTKPQWNTGPGSRLLRLERKLENLGWNIFTQLTKIQCSRGS